MMGKVSCIYRLENEEVLPGVKEERNTLHTKKLEGNLTELATSCLGTALSNMFLKERWKIREGEEDVSSYWMNLREREDIGNWKH